MGGPDAPPEQRLTLRCLESVRRHLPGAEVVFSTWPDADVTGLPVDQLVRSEDPGAQPYTHSSMQPPTLWPGNRVIVSSVAGLRAATRPYAMKMRSDLLLTDARFLGLWGRYPRRAAEWRATRERVLSPSFFAAHPHSTRRYPFHVSDWWMFGRHDDLLDIWDVPLAGPELPRWYETRPQPPNEAEPRLLCRYYVEQWFWVNFLWKHGAVPFAHKTDCNPEAVRISELSFANNLQLHHLVDLGLEFLKSKIPYKVWGDIYTHGDWERLYRRYCNPAFVPGPDLQRLRYRIYEAAQHPGEVRGYTRLERTWERLSPGTYPAFTRWVQGLRESTGQWTAE